MPPPSDSPWWEVLPTSEDGVSQGWHPNGRHPRTRDRVCSDCFLHLGMHAEVPRLSKKALIFASCRACLTSLSPAYNLLSIVFWACHLLELSMCRCVWLHAKASA